MKKIIVTMILIILNACTTMPKFDSEELKSDFISFKREFIDVVKKNQREDINKFFVKSFRNNIILEEIKKVNLSELIIIIPDSEIKLNKFNEINTLVILNSGTTSAYFDVVWLKVDGMWKISSFYEK